jgi:hypothetical protein
MKDSPNQGLKVEDNNLHLSASGLVHFLLQFEESLPQALFNRLVKSFFNYKDNTFHLNSKLDLSYAGDFNLTLKEDYIVFEGVMGIIYSLNPNLKWSGKLLSEFSVQLFHNGNLITPQVKINKTSWKEKPQITGRKRSISVGGISDLVLSLFRSALERRINLEVQSNFNPDTVINRINEQLSKLINANNYHGPQISLQIVAPSFSLKTFGVVNSFDTCSEIHIANQGNFGKTSRTEKETQKQSGEQSKSEMAFEAQLPWKLIRKFLDDAGHQFGMDVPLINSRLKPVDIGFVNGLLLVVLNISGKFNGKMEIFLSPEVKKDQLFFDVIDFKLATKSRLQNALIGLSKARTKKLIQQGLESTIVNLHHLFNDNLPEQIEMLQEEWGLDVQLKFKPFQFKHISISDNSLEIAMLLRFNCKGNIDSPANLSESLNRLLLKQLGESQK